MRRFVISRSDRFFGGANVKIKSEPLISRPRNNWNISKEFRREYEYLF